MQIPVNPRPQQPNRLPFPAQGFPTTFNPTGAPIIQNDDALQNYLRSMQMSSITQPQRPQGDIAQLMALMAANNQPRASLNVDDLKRKDIIPQISGIDQNSIAQQLAMRQDELRLIQMRNATSQQQQQQLMQMAAFTQQQQQQQQQNEQRRRSLSIPQPSQLNLQLLNSHSSDSSLNQNINISPVKESNSTPSASSSSPQIQHQQQQQTSDSPHSNIGPDEKKYQLFLHSIDLFNKKVIEENDGSVLTERLNIPSSIVEAARYTHLAKIQVPSPTIDLDDIQPGMKSILEDLTKNAQPEIINSMM